MTTPGPYQYCSTCGKERAHNWIAETTYACIGCNKETKVYLRKALEKIGAEVKSPVQEGLSHLDSEALANVQQSMNVIQEKLEEVKEIIEDKGFVTELPKQGFEIKHTPLDDGCTIHRMPATPIYIKPENREKLLADGFIVKHGELKASEIVERFADSLSEDQKELLNDFQPVQKGWADGL